MGKLFGVSQVLIGCGVIFFTLWMYFTNCDVEYDDWKQDVIKSICRIEEARQQNDRDMQGIIKIQKKIVSGAVQSVTLASKGLDAVVSVKDYTVMKTKPFACIGDVFSGIQKEMHACVKDTKKLEDDLNSVQKRVNSQTKAVRELQQLLEKNMEAERQQKTGRLMLLLALTLSGIGFVISGCSLLSKQKQS